MRASLSIGLALAAALAWLPLSGKADDVQPHAMGAAAPPMDEASKAYEAANMKMHAGMAMDFTGDADADFVRGMIPHHQGAVDMAQVVLKYGKDPEIRKLAEGIVKAQETEIAFMKDWLAKRQK